MFRRKKNKPNKTPIEIHKELFYEYQKHDCEDKKLVAFIYDEIKTDYEKLLRYGLLNIHIERIRINKSLGKYSDTTSKRYDLNKMIVILCFTTILNVLLKIFDVKELGFLNGFQYVLYMLCVLCFMYSLFKEDGKFKTKEKDLVNNISLIVLDDIEKSINEDIRHEVTIEKDIKYKEIESTEEAELKTIKTSKNERAITKR